MRKCVLCKKTLVPIGNARKSGKATHDDWETRKYHKKCWLLKRDIERISKTYKTNEDDKLEFF